MSSVSIRPGNGSAAALPDSAEALHEVVRAERHELKRSLGELESALRNKLNVRSRLLDHPLTSIGAACAAGVVLGVMSNRAPRDRPRAGRSAMAGDRHARRSAGTAMGPIGRMASTVTALVAQRLADVAEDSLRRAFSPHTTPGTRRDAPVVPSTPVDHHD